MQEKPEIARPFLETAALMGDDRDDIIVYIAREPGRDAHKSILDWKSAKQIYKDYLVTNVWPYISEDGTYHGNVYVVRARKEED